MSLLSLLPQDHDVVCLVVYPPSLPEGRTNGADKEWREKQEKKMMMKQTTISKQMKEYVCFADTCSLVSSLHQD